HGGEALALYNLLLQLLLDGDIAHRDDHAAQLGLGIEKLAGGRAHGAPASIAMTSAILCGAKNLLAGRDVMVESSQFRRMILQLRNSFPQQVLRLEAEQITHT